MIRIFSVLLSLIIVVFFILTYKKPLHIKSNPPKIQTVKTEDHIRTLIATGDVMPGRYVNVLTNRYNNFKWPYEKTASILNQADVTFINLETPLIENCPEASTGFQFCGSAKNIEGLIYAGIDVANLANNHTQNYGQTGIDETVKLLNNNGILTTGIGQIVYKDVKGMKWAFLGYNDIGDKLDDLEKIKEAKKNAKVVIVSFHWGTEYTDKPTDRQKYLARAAIDNGADIVIGNHPHWIQPIETYKNKTIIYSHGNFVFDQEWSLKTKQGIVSKFTFYDDKLIDLTILPVQIENYGQPYFLKNEEFIVYQ